MPAFAVSLGRESAPGNVVPLALQAARVARAHLDRLADLAEEPLSFPVLPRLFQQQRVAAARFLTRIIGRQCLVFMERQLELALLLEAAGVEQVALRGLKIGVGIAQRVEYLLDGGEVSA